MLNYDEEDLQGQIDDLRAQEPVQSAPMSDKEMLRQRLMQQAINPQEYKDARAEADKKMLYLNLAKAAGGIGQAIANPTQKYDSSNYDAMIKQTEAPLEDLKTIGQANNNYHSLTALNNVGKMDLGLENLAERKESRKLREKALGYNEDSKAEKAVSAIHKDPIVVKGQQQINAVERGIHTLSSGVKITPSLLSEIQMDIANALSGGGVAAQGTIHRTEFSSLQQDYTRLKERLTNQPQDVNSPELKSQLMNVMSRLKNAYQQSVGERAKSLSVGRNYLHTPAAKSAVSEVVKHYADMSNEVDENDPRVQEALKNGYSMEEIRKHLNGR
jgi:hypothetical protein